MYSKAVASGCGGQNGPFGCGAAAMPNFGLYLTVVVSGFGATAHAIKGGPRSQVHHRHEERIP